MTATLFHLLVPGDWPAALRAGEVRPASLAAEGFVHLSYAHQVSGSANRHFHEAAELFVLEVGPGRLPGELRVEDSYGSGTAFPHYYGPLPVAAVVAVRELDRDRAGRWVFSPGDAGATA
jgi:uncharacterized protein (DUF952 family)